MAIPKYNEMYRAFLDCLADMQPHKAKDVKIIIAAKLGVTDEEQQELLPSGHMTIFSNRVGWARTYLKKAGLIDSPARGVYCLSPIGKGVLDENPAIIDNHYLERFDSFQEFVNSTKPSERSLLQDDSDQTPQDTLDAAFQQMNCALADDLLSEILKQTPAFFERLVVRLLEKMGYGGSLDNAGNVVGKSGDEGIDGIIKEDKLGFNSIYIQAKRWELDATIGRPEIQKFVGALAGQGADKGLFITTAQFTKEAKDYVKKQHTTKVVLVDGPSLAKYMIENDLGVSTETIYAIKRLDSDFFGDGSD